jgi:hypothetical protein
MRKLCVIVCFLQFLSLDSEAFVSLRDTLILHKGREPRLLILPLILRSPVTRWGTGIAHSYIFQAHKFDSTSRASNIEALGFYTQNKQLVLVLGTNLYTKDERYIIHWRNSFSSFPDKFWGLGNETPAKNLEQYAYKQYLINPQLLRKISRKFYTGLFYEYQNMFSMSYDRAGLFDKERIIGRGGSKVSGGGILLAWDSRNSAFSPDKGFFIQVSAIDFTHALGSQFNFRNYQLDARSFHLLSRKSVLGFQLVSYLTNGDVPLRNLAVLGGSDIMRGYYAGRYRDNNMIAGQTEYRLNIFKRLGIVAFGSGGRVSSQVKKMSLHGIKYAVGSGVRIALKPQDKLNFRIDYGKGYKSNGLYFTVTEAF